MDNFEEKICAVFGVAPHLIGERHIPESRYQESEEAYAYWEAYRRIGIDLPMDDLVFEARWRRARRELGI